MVSEEGSSKSTCAPLFEPNSAEDAADKTSPHSRLNTLHFKADIDIDSVFCFFLFLDEKVMSDDEFTCDLFRFLQLLCEGHNNG